MKPFQGLNKRRTPGGLSLEKLAGAKLSMHDQQRQQQAKDKRQALAAARINNLFETQKASAKACQGRWCESSAGIGHSDYLYCTCPVA